MAQAVIGIDPRIRARRVAVRRAEGRRRLRALLGGLGVVATVVGAWALTRTPLLDLDHVRIEGVSSGSLEEVEAAAGLTTGSALLDVDLGTVASEVEALPWVETAAVRRDWPGTVRIDVVERVPAARVPGADGAVGVVDVHGVVTAVVPATGATSLPLIDVELAVEPGAVQETLLPGLAVVERLPADLRPWVDRVLVDPPSGDVGTVALDLRGSAFALLGDTTLLDDKIAAVRAVLAGADLDCISIVDVRVADLTTISRDPRCDGRATPGDG